jgi:uncharacterized protein YbjT (DUF2867 family)
MTAPILVTGGTGTLGRYVVSRLREAGRAAGREVRVLSRRGRTGGDGSREDGIGDGGIRYVAGDLATGAGLQPAVAGVGTIVHCASSTRGDADATRNLVRAASQTGAPHLVYISIVGVDRLSYGYLRTKLECERLVAGSGLPWTTLRATQFYDLILRGAKQLARLPVIPVPAGFVVQPIDPGDVAARLAELALGEPAGRVPDLGGPRVYSFADLIRGYLRASGRRRWVVPVRMPGTRAIRAGGLLPAQPAGPVTGHRTWEEFLDRTIHSGQPRRRSAGPSP